MMQSNGQPLSPDLAESLSVDKYSGFSRQVKILKKLVTLGQREDKSKLQFITGLTLDELSKMLADIESITLDTSKSVHEDECLCIQGELGTIFITPFKDVTKPDDREMVLNERAGIKIVATAGTDYFIITDSQFLSLKGDQPYPEMMRDPHPVLNDWRVN